MGFIVDNISWIMLASGILTMTMLYAAISPQAALQSSFGETLTGPLAEIIVRNWAALIGLIGAMLIYGAYTPDSRALILIVAGLSKIVFIGLVLSQGGRYLKRQVGVAIAVDALMLLLFAIYIVASRGT